MTSRDIIRVADIDCRIAPYDWAFAREEAEMIDAHWATRRRTTPSLFDGRVLLMRDLDVRDGILRCLCFETGYKSFLAWRERGFPGAAVANCFGMAALQAADGPFMLGEMSASTAAGGRLYFPAGTPEPADLDASGRIDFRANILRELAEETGIGAQRLTLESGWTIVFDGPTVACMKRARCATSAAEMQADLSAYNLSQPDPELVALVPIGGPGDYGGARIPPFMQHYLNWALAGQ